MTDKIVILGTCGSEAEAERLSKMLVERRLAACVTVIPQARSFYWWQGAVETATEYVLLIKTSRALFESLSREFKAAHSYETPEAIALEIVDGIPDYLKWIDNSLHQK